MHHRALPILALTTLFSLVVHAEAPPAKAAEAAGSMSAPAAYQELVKGNARFAGGKAKHGDQTPAVRKKLTTGQHPHSIVVTCSDSRVSPELAFDQGLGRLFVVREAGNMVDAHGIASIEYAVEHLGTRLIVIMGHDSCGAVKAALGTKPGTSAGSPSLDVLVKDLQKNLATAELSDADKQDPLVHKAVQTNANAVRAQLAAASPLLKAKLDDGSLAIVSGVYALDTGKVQFEGDEALKAGGQKKPAAATAAPAAPAPAPAAKTEPAKPAPAPAAKPEPTPPKK